MKLHDNHWHSDCETASIAENITYFKNLLDTCHPDSVTLLSIPTREHQYTRFANLKALAIKEALGGRAYAFLGLWHKDHPTAQDYVTQLEDGLAMGFDGVKSLEEKPDVRKFTGRSIADPIFDPVYDRMEALQVPFVLHAADPGFAWTRALCTQYMLDHGRCYDAPGYLSKEEIYAEVDEMLAKHPHLRLTLAHFYFLSDDLPRAAKFLDAHPQVCFDLVPGREMYTDFGNHVPEARAFFARYADRMIFGTDINSYGANDPHTAQYHRDLFAYTKAMIDENGEREFCGKTYRGMGLPTDLCEKIFYTNAMHFLHDRTPKPIDRALAIQALAAQKPYQADFTEEDARDFADLQEYFGVKV